MCMHTLVLVSARAHVGVWLCVHILGLALGAREPALPPCCAAPGCSLRHCLRLSLWASVETVKYRNCL